MKVVIQRVKNASVKINNEVYSSINKGFLVYLGVHHDDTLEDVIKYATKVSNLRVFEDNDGKMNLSLKDIKGEILVVSQFTLYGNAKKGNRPSFIEAARPEHATKLYEAFIEHLNKDFNVKTGVFGANMEVSSINDGPVTIIIDNL